MKTLKLFYPEWQGYGEDNRVQKGALTVKKMFGRGRSYVDIDIPEDETLIIEQGILGYAPILRTSAYSIQIAKSEQPDRVFMIGGTCASEIAPISYLNQHYQKDLTVLWFDAHADLNTPDTSPSSHFHGMILRTLLGEGSLQITDLVSSPLNASQVVLAGVRDLDDAEAEFISEQEIQLIPPEQVAESSSLVAAIERCGSSNLYIHLDLDFFSPQDFKGAQVESPGGITIDQFTPVLSDLNAGFNIVGLSLVEYASTQTGPVEKLIEMLEKSRIIFPFI